MTTHGSIARAKRVPIDELVILPFEGFPAQIAQVLAADLAAQGVTTRVDAPVPLPDAAYSPTRCTSRSLSALDLAQSAHGKRRR